MDVYLDHNATTPLDERVLDAMLPYLREHHGNAASRTHRHGQEAATAVEVAREQVADLVGALPKEVIWTSGATESDKGLQDFVWVTALTASRPGPPPTPRSYGPTVVRVGQVRAAPAPTPVGDLRGRLLIRQR